MHRVNIVSKRYDRLVDNQRHDPWIPAGIVAGDRVDWDIGLHRVLHQQNHQVMEEKDSYL